MAFLSLGSRFSDELRVIPFRTFPALRLVGSAVILFIAKQMPPFAAATWNLVLSGGIGNLLDRLLHDGRVLLLFHRAVDSRSIPAYTEGIHHGRRVPASASSL